MADSKFESMGEDMMVVVFLKVGQNLKAVIRLRCVSKSWRRLVNSRCLPKLTCNDPLELKGHLMKMEFADLDNIIEYPTPSLAYAPHRCLGDDNHHFGQEEGGRRLLLELEKLKDRGLIFLDACNGLLLHRLNNDNNSNNNDSSSSPPPPVYLVSNLETNSWIVVNGEADTADNMFNKTDHVALAYNPAESLMSFKIVAFFRRPLAGCCGLRHKCMRIYSSKTGKWSPDLNFDHLLHPTFTAHDCLQQSVYLNGAIYRLLVRGFYLLRFETDIEGNCCNERHPRAQAIRLPKGGDHNLGFHQNLHVGINRGQLNLAWLCVPIPGTAASFTDLGQGLRVWVLQEEEEEIHGGNNNNYSYQWIPKHRINISEIPGLQLQEPIDIGITCPVGFHPNEDAIVIISLDGFQFRFSCYHFHRKLLMRSSVSTSYDYALCSSGNMNPEDVGLRPYSFPIFSCAVPLISQGKGRTC